MSAESEELAVYAENNGDLYRQRIEPVIKNLALKKVRGVYDPQKALILWKYVADDAAQRYTKEFDPDSFHHYKGVKTSGIFTVEDKRDAAKELAEYYAEQVDDFFSGENQHLLPKKYRHKNPEANPDDDFLVKARNSIKPYGYGISEDREIILPNGKLVAVYVERKKNRAVILDKNNRLLWSGSPSNLNNFIEKFWFAKRKNPAGKIHTKKWDRCVRDVKAKHEAADPYAVCTASLGYRGSVKAGHRRRNPVNGFLLSVKNTATGQRAYYTGEEPEAFDSNKMRGKIYATAAHARAAAGMLQRDKHLKPGWRYAVVIASNVNPAVAPAEKLYTDFHGEPPRRIKRRVLPQFTEGLEIGPVAAITYDTVRDGKKIRFEHEFKKRAAPLLITNGRTLALTGGRYRFTDRGIVDRET